MQLFADILNLFLYKNQGYIELCLFGRLYVCQIIPQSASLSQFFFWLAHYFFLLFL